MNDALNTGAAMNANEIKAGMRVYSTTFKKNVEVVRVFASTVTVQCWGSGLATGKFVTFKGQRMDTLEPAHRTEE